MRNRVVLIVLFLAAIGLSFGGLLGSASCQQRQNSPGGQVGQQTDGERTGSPMIEIQRAFPALSFQEPLWMFQAPGDSSYWYLLEKRGRIYRFQNSPNPGSASLVADLTGRVISRHYEAGLLGAAFDPGYGENRFVYLYYTGTGAGRTQLQGILSRFTMSADGSRLNPGSEVRIMEIDQPFANHNGGGIIFGPDGYLYMGLGDGGSAGDPQNHAQNPNSLLGKMLRIDVRGGGTGGRMYSIPPDNPYANGEGGRPEVFALGLRNPWRWSFDRETGSLWAGDVGQDAYEEINIIRRSGNYGWNRMEGSQCFAGRECDPSRYILPVVEYPLTPHRAVVGGYVYRGNAFPALRGRYLFGDYGSGQLWLLDNPYGENPTMREVGNAGMEISSFAEGNDGELYMLGINTGRILRVLMRRE